MKIQQEYQDLIKEFMKAIIANQNYEFRQEDKKKYYNSMTQTHSQLMRYELTVLEATRYADALMARNS